jgi:hypothetical protein
VNAPTPADSGSGTPLSQLLTAYELAGLARAEVIKAADGLTGARRSRAMQLAADLGAAEALGKRLHFVVSGDARAEAGQR